MNQAIPLNSPSHAMWVRLFFGLTIGLGAGLLFWQQLMLGRMMLPKFGGVPAVWLVSLAVFQTILLLGYALAHGVRQWGRGATFFLLAAFAISAALQQIFLPQLMAPDVVTPWAVIAALCSLALFSLFLFSMISPLLQGIYARLPQPDAKDPYFLYSASNLGSFAGLLLFPLLIEPFGGLALSHQLWMGVAVVFLICLFVSLSMAGGEKKAEERSAPTEARKRWPLWLFLSFLPSALSFGATAHLINDIAPVPLMSMVPLALYLLTFVAAFGKSSRWQEILIGIQPFLVAFYMYRLVASGIHPKQVYDLLLVLGVFFTSALKCHRALADSRPPTADLTFFYLIVALGGALGAIINLTIIPFVFPLPLEFSLFVLVSLLLDWKQDWKNFFKGEWGRLRILVLGAGAVSLGIIFFQERSVSQLVPAILAIAFACLSIMPTLLAGFSVLAIIISVSMLPPMMALERDFYGVKRVAGRTVAEDNHKYRALFHGTTLHGMQQITPQMSLEPLLYYGKGSGLDDVMNQLKPKKVGVVGLGVGAIACMPGKEAKTTFFEIDPSVVRLAKQQFSFLVSCPPENIVLGDARLTLAKDTGKYDLLIIDAFSSDSIPVHLLTKEAFEIYKARLSENGVLLLHLSNRYLDLRPVAQAAAQELHWSIAHKIWKPEGKTGRVTASEYAVLTSHGAFIDKLYAHDKTWTRFEGDTPVLWTDDKMAAGDKEWTRFESVEPILWTDDKLSIVPLIRLLREDNYAEKK
jgi:hypothetical protein